MIVLDQLCESFFTIYKEINHNRTKLGSVSHCMLDGDFYAYSDDDKYLGNYERKQHAIDTVVNGSPTLTVY